MAWTDPTGWPVGQLANAAFMNTHIRDNFNYLYDAPACQLTHSTTQSAGTGGEIHVDFDTEVNDPDGMHAAGSSDFIDLSRTGLWWLSAAIKFTTTFSASDPAWLRVDVIFRAIGWTGAGTHGTVVGGLGYHPAAKRITCQVNHNHTAGATIDTGPEYGVQWLHA